VPTTKNNRPPVLQPQEKIIRAIPKDESIHTYMPARRALEQFHLLLIVLKLRAASSVETIETSRLSVLLKT
jgi:hypothetical protein